MPNEIQFYTKDTPSQTRELLERYGYTCEGTCELPRGWLPLLKKLLDMLAVIPIKNKELLQVKEKFGRFVFDMKVREISAQAIIDLYVVQALNYCMNCGNNNYPHLTMLNKHPSDTNVLCVPCKRIEREEYDEYIRKQRERKEKAKLNKE